jgi:hypothetical protein
MAHFAKLDENNVVLEVIVVSNEALDSSNEEASGIAFLTEWSGGHASWKQTSYNASFRKHYAKVGDTYDESHDAFIEPKQFESWSLNEETCEWMPPVPYPRDDKFYDWDESSLSWIEIAP